MIKLPRQTSIPVSYTRTSNERAFANGFTPETGEIRQQAATLSPPPEKPVPEVAIRDTKIYDFYSSTISVANVVVTAVGPNANRRYLAIQNTGAVNVFLGFGTVASTNGTSSVILPPNSVYTFENGIVPNNGVSAICSTSAILSIVEGVTRG